MAGGGKADATAQYIARVTGEAAEQAASGTITAEMAELLTAVRNLRVANVDGRWAIDVSWLARVALDAGLVAQVGQDGRTVLKLTQSGRKATSVEMWRRLTREMVQLARARRYGRERAEEEAAELARADRRRRRVTGLLLAVVTGTVGVAAGYAAAGWQW